MQEDKKLGIIDTVLMHSATYVLISVAILACDIFSGADLHLAIIYVIPVVMAAWFRGFRFALVLGIGLPVCRIPIAVMLKQISPLPYALLNAAIRIAVLWLVAQLVTTKSRHSRTLKKEVEVLEGLLPICAHCKSIRDEKKEWHQMEEYISEHSEANFSHGICPACMRKHYGEFINDDKS